MSKSHRDNHAARVKRGPEAFAKKAERRAEGSKVKCNRCGRDVRATRVVAGLCPICLRVTVP